MNHPTIKVKVGGYEADIDVKIASLIEEIWKAGINTSNSCQENQEGITWIEFFTTCDAKRFLDIVAQEFDETPESLYSRIRGAWDYSKPWKFDIYIHDWSVDEIIEDGGINEWSTGSPDFIFSVSIRFPMSDIPELVHRLKKHNELKQCTCCGQFKDKSDFHSHD